LLPFEWADRPERVNDALLELGKGENPAITLRAELGQILDRASDEASAGSMFEDYYGLVGIVE
jgi:hypothetical protein